MIKTWLSQKNPLISFPKPSKPPYKTVNAWSFFSLAKVIPLITARILWTWASCLCGGTDTCTSCFLACIVCGNGLIFKVSIAFESEEASVVFHWEFCHDLLFTVWFVKEMGELRPAEVRQSRKVELLEDTPSVSSWVSSVSRWANVAVLYLCTAKGSTRANSLGWVRCLKWWT